MPLYRFIVHYRGWRDTPTETELPNDDVAWTAALEMIGDLKGSESIPIVSGHNTKSWESWSIEVRESDRQLCNIPFNAP